MTQEVVSPQLLEGGSGLVDQLPKIIREESGRTLTVVAGAVAGTEMAIPAMRLEDTILAVIVSAAGVLSDDVANCTIVDTHASGTLTVTGTPLEGETFVVGANTYTFRAIPLAGTDVLISAVVATQAALIAAAINAYEARYTSQGNLKASVSATSLAGVVTITSVVDGAGDAITATSSGAHNVIAGTGTASVTSTPTGMVDTDSITVNGVTFTVKAAPVVSVWTDVAIGASDAAQGALLANAINGYKSAYGTLGVSAVANGAGVVTITPIGPLTGNMIPLTEAATGVAASGAGTLAGGSNTGGFKSTTDLSSKSVVVHWLNKR